MSAVKLPDGFSWVNENKLVIRHVDSGRDLRVSDAIIWCDSRPESVQAEVDFACTLAGKRHVLDRLWVECGLDRSLFAARRKELAPLEIME